VDVGALGDGGERGFLGLGDVVEVAGVALEILDLGIDEARALISGKVESMAQLESQIQVAQAYAALNPTFSGSMIDPLVDEFNRDLNAAAVLDRFDVAGVVVSAVAGKNWPHSGCLAARGASSSNCD